jgi:hypothetical protein
MTAWRDALLTALAILIIAAIIVTLGAGLMLASEAWEPWMLLLLVQP